MNFITGKLRCSTENKNLSTTSTTEKPTLKSQAKTFCKEIELKSDIDMTSSKYQFSFNNLSTIKQRVNFLTPAVPKDLSL